MTASTAHDVGPVQLCRHLNSFKNMYWYMRCLQLYRLPKLSHVCGDNLTACYSAYVSRHVTSWPSRGMSGLAQTKIETESDVSLPWYGACTLWLR